MIHYGWDEGLGRAKETSPVETAIRPDSLRSICDCAYIQHEHKSSITIEGTLYFPKLRRRSHLVSDNDSWKSVSRSGCSGYSKPLCKTGEALTVTNVVHKDNH